MNAFQGETTPEDAEGHEWDVIVVGAGAGGATAGFNLARRGRSVLFVERGKLLDHDPDVERGVPYRWTGDPEAALNHGWWPRHFHHRDGEDGAFVPTRPPIGCGAGGSTAQFNGAMDRFRPQDFTPRQFFRDVPETSLPEAWPISYEELAPYYEQAERLYRVRGTQDPLAPSGPSLLEPPPASDKERAVFGALESVGLHPYRIHSTLEHLPGCLGCPGMLCPRACRNDAARACLFPALERHGANILASCRAIRFEARGSVVERVICERDGRRFALRARVFILAANAFLTPALLQRSTGDRFPNGLANGSGMVGRNLMLHAASHLFIGLKRGSRGPDFQMNHGLSLNDFYVHEGTKLGNMHAHPVVTRDEFMTYLVKHQAGVKFLPGRLISLIASMAPSLKDPWTAVAAIVEDLPYPDNRVAARAGSDEDIEYTYRYPDELRSRARTMSAAFSRAVAPLFDVRPLQATGALNGSHVCGTCRFGDDPRASVLDRDNRAHELDNFYVLDASFFPSSGGINPSLTIAANSLRATDKIARGL